MSGHPLERFSRDLTLFGAKRVAELTGSEPDIWMAGIVSGLRPLKTRKGDRMAVFMLDDVDGSVEVVVFPETFGKHGILIDSRRHAARPRQTRKRRRVGAAGGHRAPAHRRADGADDPRSGDPPEGAAAWPAGLRGAGRAAVAAPRRSARVRSSSTSAAPTAPLRVRAEVTQRVKPSERLVAEVEQLCGTGSVELR